MKILVLGSSGVIGKNLCSYLLSKSHTVHKFDIYENSQNDLRINAPDMKDFDFIYFLAYDIGGSKYLNNQNINFINNNVKIMVNTFNELEKTKKPFIFASSQMQNMYCPYGTLKRLGEHYTTILGGISVRFWNVYGPEEINIKSHVISDFIYQKIKYNKIKLLTTGEEERQFLHVDDCAEVLYIILEKYKELDKRIIDISNFKWLKIKDLAKIICNEVELGTKVDTVQEIKNEPDEYILQFWKPKISIEDGLHKIEEFLDTSL